ncbi:MAG: hypothetical protein Q9207_002053 [Kuettlingeria erythrocarpa]
MLSFLQSFAKKKTAIQPTMTRSDSMDSAMPSSAGGSSLKRDKDSTPATGMGDTASIVLDTTPDPRQRGGGLRSLRARRSNISSYNENVLSRSAKHGYRKTGVDSSSRAVSGKTLVDGKGNPTTDFVQQSTLGLDQHWSLASLPGNSLSVLSRSAEDARKRIFTRLSVLDFASSVMEQTKSVLGKRGRADISSGAENTSSVKQGSGSHTTLRNAEKQKDEGPVSKKLRRESNLEDRASIVISAHKRPAKLPVKKWLSQGLYVGQDADFDPRFTTVKNKLKKANTPSDASKRRSMLPLPMFAGQRILETGRDFKLPFDVFSPLPAGQPKPDEWKKTHKNVFIGDAAAVWRKSGLEASRCVCSPEDGCDHDCLNRHMFYECDDNNCNVGAEHCQNRAFEGLKQRHKKGGIYNIGVEVIKTADRGYGVRSNRTFEPNQIIVEYTGEIITQDECDERMENRYKDNECFYLMEFDQKMILDATRGSIARFINHSCEPNCEMIKMTVAGKPRMALFAGENGIMTGEELTYDYNFNPYSVKNVQQCRCGAPSCRGVLGPKPKEIKDALKATTTGGKPQDTPSKRKINLPSGIKKAFNDAKIQTTDKLPNVPFGKAEEKKEEKEDEQKPLVKLPSKVKEEIEEAAADESKVGEEGGGRPVSRRRNVKAAAHSVRKNVVWTVKRSGRTNIGGQQGKSIRVIDDA